MGRKLARIRISNEAFCNMMGFPQGTVLVQLRSANTLGHDHQPEIEAIVDHGDLEEITPGSEIPIRVPTYAQQCFAKFKDWGVG